MIQIQLEIPPESLDPSIVVQTRKECTRDLYAAIIGRHSLQEAFSFSFRFGYIAMLFESLAQSNPCSANVHLEIKKGVWAAHGIITAWTGQTRDIAREITSYGYQSLAQLSTDFPNGIADYNLSAQRSIVGVTPKA